jgi:exodeoxyribonuclease V gamma subunit
MLTIFRSNNLLSLSKMLSLRISDTDEQPDSPFSPVDIAVGSKGMERWLRYRLADDLGIAANIRFPFPTPAIDAIIQQVTGDPSQSPWSPLPLSLAIAEVLPTLATEHPELCEPLTPFISTDSAPLSDTHIAFATELANIFDTYIAYRSEICLRWDAGTLNEDDLKQLPWQPHLWHALRTRFGEEASHRLTSRNSAQQVLKKSPGMLLSQPALRIFGLSALPPTLVTDIATVAPHLEVELYLLTPSKEYWANVARQTTLGARDLLSTVAFDEDGCHPLLGSLGRPAGELQDALINTFEGRLREVESYDIPLQHCAAPTTLQFLQDDILHARSTAQLLTACKGGDRPAEGDNSLQIHATYGAMRQVEALQASLHHLLNDNKNLELRDILVMTPDLDTYAPLVQAVFGNGQRYREDNDLPWGAVGTPALHIKVSDLSLRRSNPVADALMRVFEIATGRLTQRMFIDLLSLEPVLHRFNLTDDDVPEIEEMFRESGFRWAVDATDRALHAQPHDAQNTLTFALNRLALGLVIGDDTDLFEGHAPLSTKEGRSARVLGEVIHFGHAVIHAHQALQQDRTLSDWIALLIGGAEYTGLIAQITKTHQDNQWLTERLLKEVATLQSAVDLADTCRVYTANAFSTLLGARLDIAAGGVNQQTGSITLCSMRPERSIPYRVIALLGLDDGLFPRTLRRSGFDLTSLTPTRGDRNPGDEDRTIFLEALLSAKDNLLIFYTGKSETDQAVLSAAVPVEQLKDTLDVSFPGGAEVYTTYHPLHPFHPDLLQPGPHQSFSKHTLQAAQALNAHAAPAPSFLHTVPATEVTTKTVTIEELVRWLKKPTERYVRQSWKIYLTQYDDDVENREPIELSALDKYTLPATILEQTIRGEHQSDTTAEILAARGILPLGEHGKSLLRQQQILANTLIQTLDEHGLGTVSHTPIDIQIAGVQLTGSAATRGGRSVALSLREEKTGDQRHVIQPWVEHLARAVTQNEPIKPLISLHQFIGKPTKSDSTGRKLQVRTFICEDPHAVLSGLVKLYLSATQGQIPLFRYASFSFSNAWLGSTKISPRKPPSPDIPSGPAHPAWDSFVAASKKAMSSYASGSDFSSTDLDNPSVKLAHGTDAPFRSKNDARVVSQAFAKAALQLWQPILSDRTTKPNKLSGVL